MINSILDSPVGEVGGYTTAGTAILLQIGATLNISDVNPWITAVTGLAGLVFLIYKIKNIKLDNKIKKQKIERDNILDVDINRPEKLN
jgi:lantibiotic modifying enzyme